MLLCRILICQRYSASIPFSASSRPSLIMCIPYRNRASPPKRDNMLSVVINKFLSKYEGRYTYESLKKDDAEEILAFQKKWFDDASSKDGKETLDYETSAIAELFENFDKFNLRGGILRVDGDIAAYCIASKINDTALDIMVEKASGEYIGAYQMINKLFAENGCRDIEYINREEDMGIEGLRRAKLSYCPELLIKKYGAIWKR